MALNLLLEVVQAVDSVVMISDAAKQGARSRLGPLFGVATAGFLTILGLSLWLNLPALAGFCVLPPGLMSAIGARRAWFSPSGRKPFLMATFVACSLACLFYLVPFLFPRDGISALAAGRWVLASVGAVLTGLALLVWAYLRDEWQQF